MARSHPPHLRPVAAAPAGTPAVPTTKELEQLAASGDLDAWAALYNEHYATVFRQVRYLCGERSLAEELTQEAFAQAMASRQRYDARRAFAAWMHGIALNVVRKYWRKNRNRGRAMQRYEFVDNARPRHGDPDGSHLRRERSRVLYEVLDELPPRWREAFVLRELQGMPTREAAERLQISTANLCVRVARARGRIRDALAQRGWLDEGAAR